MEDNEIIKALECCDSPVGETVLDGALDLINRTKEKEKHYRQKVQNQRETINALQDKINRQKAEVERLCIELDETIIAKDLLFDEAEALIKKAKAEAVKEFAERLKADCPGELLVIHFDAIDNLVKEMVGEQNDHNP